MEWDSFRHKPYVSDQCWVKMPLASSSENVSLFLLAFSQVLRHFTKENIIFQAEKYSLNREWGARYTAQNDSEGLC